MHEPHLSAAHAAVAAATGFGVTAVLESTALKFFGLPLAAVTAAMTGALVPALLLDPEPLAMAVRRWMGSVALSLVATGLLLLVLELDRAYVVGVAGMVAVFGRDLFSLARGQLPPLVGALRERITGKPGPGTPHDGDR